MKWGYFLLGFLPAVVVVLATLLTVSESSAVPASPGRISQDGETLMLIPFGLGAAGAPGGGGPGGVSGHNAGLWVVYQRRPNEAERTLLGKDFVGERTTMALYRVDSWGGSTKQGSVSFLDIRESAYDHLVVGLDAATTQEIEGYRRAWDDAIKKLKD